MSAGQGKTRPTGARLVCAAGVFVGLLAVYLLTIIPTVVDQDSGELVTAAHVLGVAHPTGYPLWVMLGRVFDLLPLGHTSAYRVALLSAVCAAAASAALAWLVGSLTGLASAGLFAGLAFGLWFPTWSQAVLAEVYGLAGVIYALFLLALWRWEGERTPRRLWWLALAGGFVGMHHRTQGLAAAPAVAMAFWLTRPRRARVWLVGGLLALAPFLCYLYLPIRAAANPPMNWGDPSSLKRFLDHALGRQYMHLAFANSPEVAWRQTLRLMSDCLAGEGWLSWALAAIGLPVIAAGLREWSRRGRALLAALLVGDALLWVWVVHWGDTYDQKVFLTPVGALAAMLGGLGLAGLGKAFGRRGVGAAAMAGVGAGVAAILLAANWGRCDRSDTWRHRDQWAAALSQMEEKAIFVAESDNPVNAIFYLQQVEGMRQDVTLIEPTALWSDWYAELFADRELGRRAERLWRDIAAEHDVHSSQGAEYGQCSAILAARLAEHYRGRRRVYALHGPLTAPLPTPPYYVGLSQDLVRLDFELPNVARTGDRAGAMAEGPDGAALVGFEMEKREAQAGEMVGFEARWRLRSPLHGWAFGLRLRPAEGPAADEAGLRRLEDKGFFVQGFKPVYGLWGMPACPPGTVYVQQGKLFIPSNASPGRYTVEIGFASSPPDYRGWTPLGKEGGLVVRSGPLPSNGP